MVKKVVSIDLNKSIVVVKWYFLGLLVFSTFVPYWNSSILEKLDKIIDLMDANQVADSMANRVLGGLTKQLNSANQVA